MMYSNKGGKVERKSSSPLHQNNGQEVVACSALGILNSILPGDALCHEGVEGDMPNGEDRAFTRQQNISGEQQMIYSATGSVMRNSRPEGAKIFHGVLEGDVRSSDDSGFREHDNITQNSNESRSYVEVNPAKTGNYENVTCFPKTTEGRVQSLLSERHASDEEALREELLNMFEMYFKTKMEERLRAFRSRQMEWEEASRIEKEEIGNKMAKEKIEMQRHFADAISKLTDSFNEERKQLEQCYEEQLKDLRKKLGTGQKGMDGKYAKDELEFMERLGDEDHVTLMKETWKQEALREKSEIKARFNKEKFDLEKNFNFLLTEAEANLHTVRMELKESMQMQKEHQKTILDLESKLNEERQQRLDVERELEQEKAKYFREEAMSKAENEQLRSKVDELRREVEEKNGEMKRLLEANQESNLKIRALTRHLQKRVKRNSGSSVKSQEYEEAKGSEGHAAAEGRSNSPQTSTSDQQGKLAEVETRTVDTAENTIVKVYDSKMRLIDERRKILVYVTFEKRPEQGLQRILNALLPKQPSSSTVRVLMTSDAKTEEVFSEH